MRAVTVVQEVRGRLLTPKERVARLQGDFAFRNRTDQMAPPQQGAPLRFCIVAVLPRRRPYSSTEEFQMPMHVRPKEQFYGTLDSPFRNAADLHPHEKEQDQ
jgi:hypothetical protein